MKRDMPEDRLSPVETPASLRPVEQAAPTPVFVAPRAAAKSKKLTWREARSRRRKARRRGEEILAWFVVPVIVVGLIWGVGALLDLFGTTPGQVWDQAMQVKAALEKKAR